MIVEIVMGRATVGLDVGPALRAGLPSRAAGHLLVIDYYASRVRGVAIGDIVVRIGDPPPEPAYVELEPIGEVEVVARRDLVRLLEGGTLREAGPPWHRHLAVTLARPEAWIDFLERHQSRSS